jgi:hypothetical protein
VPSVPVRGAGLVTPVWSTPFRAPIPGPPLPSRVVVVTSAPATDTTPPVTLFVSETIAKVSRVTGFTDTIVTWSADENCQAWQIRDVTGAPGQTVADGVLVASGGAISGGVNQVTTISGVNLVAGDGSHVLKLFAQDLAGNWTT